MARCSGEDICLRMEMSRVRISIRAAFLSSLSYIEYDLVH